MKASATGTKTEKLRFQMGWKTKTERKAAGIIDSNVCGNCANWWPKQFKTGWGSYDFRFYCGARGTGEKGFETRASASCSSWEKPDSP